jgi:hypothetical protein
MQRRPKPLEVELSFTQREGELFECLKALRDAEWMVTHDWGGDREAVLARVDAAILKTATAFGLDAGKFASASALPQK